MNVERVNRVESLLRRSIEGIGVGEPLMLHPLLKPAKVDQESPDDRLHGFGLFDGEVVGRHTLTVAAALGARRGEV